MQKNENTDMQRTAPGRILGRIRPVVKSSIPQSGAKDYRFFADPVSVLPEEFREAKRFGFTGFMSRIGFGFNTLRGEADALAHLRETLGDGFVSFTPGIKNNKYFIMEDVQKESAVPGMDEDRDYYPVPAFGTGENPIFGGDINKFCHHILAGKPLPGLSKKYWNNETAPRVIVAAAQNLEGKVGSWIVFAPFSDDAFDGMVIREGGAYFRTKDGHALGYGKVDLKGSGLSAHIVRCSHSPLWFVPEKFLADLRSNLRPVPADEDILRELGVQHNPFASAEEPILLSSSRGKWEGLLPGKVISGAVAAAAEAAAEEKQDRKSETEPEEEPVKVPEKEAGKGKPGREKSAGPKEKESAKEKISGEEKTAGGKGTEGKNGPEPAGETEIPAEKPFTEEDFLRRLSDAAEASGLLYSRKDLINFHVSLKSSRLTILAGMSGTGKSGLVRLYAKALGLPKEQVRILAVRPSWMDDSDLLGYADMNRQVYCSAGTGLAELLREAERHPEKLWLVCFDEMNLARAEHYFAQFISILEKEDPVLSLYNPALAPRLYNSADYPPQIRIGRNVLFTGTVNVDESTYRFSDKILDRANVITLRQGRFSDLARLKRKAMPSCPEVSAETFFSFLREDSPLPTERELALLDDLNDALRGSGLAGGIGFRVAVQMGAYLENIPRSRDFSRRDGLDAQVVQRILTKLRGSFQQLSALVSENDRGETEGAIPDILEEYRDLSSFGEARAVLAAKARELKLYDYTL